MKRLAFFGLLVSSMFCWAAETPAPLLLAVASNFAPTCEVLAKEFGKANGVEVQVSSGSTGKLFAQITNGGPFHVFLSADVAHVDKLIEQGNADKDARGTYAVGRLALYCPSRTAAKDPTWLRDANIKHIAVANPETAPYGAAGVSVLTNVQLWEDVKGKIVYGENIAQTMQFVDTGAAEAGFVAYSQVIDKPASEYWLVDSEFHQELRHDAVVLTPGQKHNKAKLFLEYLQSDEAKKIIAKAGYSFIEKK